MRRKFLVCISLLLITAGARSQKSAGYLDSVKDFRANYILTHEVVKGSDRSYLQFFPIDPAYQVACRFEKVNDSQWFVMNSTGNIKKNYRIYGKLTFQLHDSSLQLCIYQSQSLMFNKDYADYLFIPFGDLTNGEETHATGRYLECHMGDIEQQRLILDFNKAYNPYCAYGSGYNCPIPPADNQLHVAIRAGEKNFGKKIP